MKRSRSLAGDVGFLRATLSKGHFLKRIDGGLARSQVDEIPQYLFCIVEGNVRADQRGMG